MHSKNYPQESRKKHNPFALVTIKNDSQIGAILNEIIECVFNLINFQRGVLNIAIKILLVILNIQKQR